jgi:DnaJ-class molecular chaperone
MIVLKCIYGLLLGAVAGFIGCIVLLVVGGIISIWDSQSVEHLANSIPPYFIILFGAIIGFIVPIVEESRRQAGQAERKRQQQGEDEEARKILEKQENIRNQLIEEDKKYDRVINCPACKGYGEVYILQRYYGEQRDDESQNDVIRRSRFHIVSKDYAEKKQWVDEDGWTYEAYKDECPHCRKTGSVYAWFEKNAICPKECTKCKGNGKLRVKEKLDIGIEEKEINCDNCNGTGKVILAKDEIVHIKTKGGWDEEKPLVTMENELQENDYIPFAKFEFGSDNPSKPYKFYVTVTYKNRDFYSKSQPRQL